MKQVDQSALLAEAQRRGLVPAPESVSADQTRSDAIEKNAAYQEAMKRGLIPQTNAAEDFTTGITTGFLKLPTGAFQAALDMAAGLTNPNEQGLVMKGIGALLSNAPGLSPEAQQKLQGLTINDARQAFAQRAGDLNQAQDLAAQNSPFATGAGDIIGQMAPLAGAGLLKGAALAGGLKPQEEVQSPGSALLDRTKGAATGAAEGYIGGKALAGAGKVIKAVAPAIAKGVAATPGMVTRVATGRDADQILAERIRGNLGSVLEDLEKGEISTLADVGDRNVRALARRVGKVSDDALNIVDSALKGRSNSAVERVSKDLSKSISHADNYFNTLDDIVSARRTLAAPLYTKAYKEAPQINSTRINTLLEDQRMIDAINDAKSNLGVRAEAPANSLETLDGAKKSIDDIIGESLRAGKNQKAASYQILKQELVKELDAASPTYAQARKVFSDHASIENAQKMGLDIFKKQPQEIKNLVKNLDNTQLEALKIGAREALQRTVLKTRTGADPAKRIFGNSVQQQQLKALFNNPKEYAQFEKRMNEEIRAADTKFEVLGGSRTDYNIADDGAFIDSAIKAAEQGITKTAIDKTVGAISNAISRRYIGLTNQNANELAHILTDRGAGIDAVKRLIAAEKSLPQKRLMQQVADEHI